MRPPGPLEIGLILLIILIVFGVGKLPQVGTALGKGISGFRKAAKGEDEEEEAEAVTKKTAKRKPKKTAKKAVKAEADEEKPEPKAADTAKSEAA